MEAEQSQREKVKTVSSELSDQFENKVICLQTILTGG